MKSVLLLLLLLLPCAARAQIVRVDTIVVVRVDTIVVVRVDTLRIAPRDTTAPDTTAPAPARGLAPPHLLPVLGPLIPQDTLLRAYDARFAQTERARWREWLANPQQLTVQHAQHYGSLLGRTQFAIRSGAPWGASIPQGDTLTMYGRGRLPVQWYLRNYAAPNRYAVPAHNNTALADVELLYVLEADTLARMHLMCSAAQGLYDNHGYLRLANPNSDARIIAVTLQALDAAHRNGLPYLGCPVNHNFARNPAYSGWREAGDSIIARLERTGAVRPDGAVPSPAHAGSEAYFMNAMLASQLLGWHRTEPHTRAFALARRIMDHLLTADSTAAATGWATLPYLSNGGSAAPDLAAYYVYPALVLWQETGDARYRDFGLRQVRATGAAFLGALKQWNQTYSTMAQTAEAMLAAVRWR